MDNRIIVHYNEFDRTSQLVVENNDNKTAISMDSNIELLSSNAVSLALQNGIDDIYILGAPFQFQDEFKRNIEETQKLVHNFNNLNVRFV